MKRLLPYLAAIAIGVLACNTPPPVASDDTDTTFTQDTTPPDSTPMIDSIAVDSVNADSL
jgi:hypothetical protein